MSDRPPSDARRLEQLWSGDFGDAYLERNRNAGEARGPFWSTMLARCAPRRVLEIGCNVGGNLRWLVPHLPPGTVWGVDVNARAIAEARQQLPTANLLLCPGRELPLRDAWFDMVFTMGVLIHQPDATLPLVMAEMVRCSRRWVLCGEYFAERPVEVPYHGQAGALFKRDYGRLFQELFPELALRQTGFLGRDQGWDDITWWLFEKA